MFTGLIQTTGTVLEISSRNREARLRVQPTCPFENVQSGESIAVNGVCLTVESFDRSSFSAFASSETLRLTNFGELARGSRVNLERAMRLGDSFGGHMVSGHVDCLCTVASVEKAGSSICYSFDFPVEFSQHIIPKGSVAVDGVSLTVNTVTNTCFSVNVIPATQQETTIGEWQKGRRINLETDLIGKYVQRMVGYFFGNDNSKPASGSKDLDLDFFRSNGF